MDGVMWGVAVASLVGTIGNCRRRRWSFLVWLATNLAWAAYDLTIGAYAQAVLMGTYAVLSVYGWWHWGRQQREE